MADMNIDHFYHDVQIHAIKIDKEKNLKYITSRSTKDVESHIDVLCKNIEYCCKNLAIPTEGTLLHKTELSIKAFKYLICNTYFSCQSLLSEDTTCGPLVDIQPPFSLYLLVEILWHLNFEDILAESFLHFPVNLCVEILEVLPRCIDLLNFERSSKFLTTLVPNVYKKLIILKDTGSQTYDINGNAKRLAGNLQELLLQFSNERFLRMEDIKKPDDKYKRYGTLLKALIQMVEMCLTTKSKVEIPSEMSKMYQLTFGREPFETIDETVLKELLTEIDRELINLLLKKVKEIDCNIYMNWTEYDDMENTSLTLQRAIGLESYFFIQNTHEYQNSNIKEYNHLVECLQQISSKPDPENSTESLKMVDLCQGVREGRLEYLMGLFRRYKEWDYSAIDCIDTSISLLDKHSCEELFEYLGGEMSHFNENTGNLQLYALCLGKALIYLKITELYEIIVKFIMKFSEEGNLDNVIDITNFERFIMLNPNFSSAKNLRVVLFFLCLNTRITLKILLKMAVGHTDYPDVAITLDDLMLLLPVLKIQTYSKHETMIHRLKSKCSLKRKSLFLSSTLLSESVRIINPFIKTETYKSETVSLAISILQNICLEGHGWNANKFSSLLQCLYTFCKVSEVVNEIFIPFLFSEFCSILYLKYILVELQKLVGRFKYGEINPDLISALQYQGLKLLNSNSISRYISDELLTMIDNLTDHLICKIINVDKSNNSDESMRVILMQLSPSVKFSIDVYNLLHKIKIADNLENYPITLSSNVLRHLMLKSTMKQYLIYASQIVESKILRYHSEIEAVENLIRLTLETCLLCLEYPDVAAPDSMGFLFRCLLKFLSTVHYKSKTKSYKRLCACLQRNILIFKDTIGYTVLKDPYSKMLKQFTDISSSLELMVDALEQFAFICMQESDNLRIYEAAHSPLAIKFWLGNDIITALFEKTVEDEENLEKLTNYLRK